MFVVSSKWDGKAVDMAGSVLNERHNLVNKNNFVKQFRTSLRHIS